MSNSVLVRLPLGADGLLNSEEVTAFQVGPVDPATGRGISGLHNLSLSAAHPGCLRLSLQYSNTVVLVDGSSLAVRCVMQVPTLMRAADGRTSPRRRWKHLLTTREKRVIGLHCEAAMSRLGYS